MTLQYSTQKIRWAMTVVVGMALLLALLGINMRDYGFRDTMLFVAVVFTLYAIQKPVLVALYERSGHLVEYTEWLDVAGYTWSVAVIDTSRTDGIRREKNKGKKKKI